METKMITENTSMEDILKDIKTPKHKIVMFYETTDMDHLSDHDKMFRLCNIILKNTKGRIRVMANFPTHRVFLYDSRKTISISLHKNGVLFCHGRPDIKRYEWNSKLNNRVNVINKILEHAN